MQSLSHNFLIFFLIFFHKLSSFSVQGLLNISQTQALQNLQKSKDNIRQLIGGNPFIFQQGQAHFFIFINVGVEDSLFAQHDWSDTRVLISDFISESYLCTVVVPSAGSHNNVQGIYCTFNWELQ